MGALARFDVFLKKPARRRRYQLAHFFEALSLYLEAGLDLGYAWPQARAALRGELGAVDDFLAWSEPESMAAVLERLSTRFPEKSVGIWFAVIGELYQRGAGLRDGVEAAARTLRESHQRELEAHCRTLPTRTNVLLLIFFLPPTMLLLFAPLLSELLRSF